MLIVDGWADFVSPQYAREPRANHEKITFPAYKKGEADAFLSVRQSFFRIFLLFSVSEPTFFIENAG